MVTSEKEQQKMWNVTPVVGLFFEAGKKKEIAKRRNFFCLTSDFKVI